MTSNQTFNQSYSGKKVLLTGHTGFKGSWMLLWLSQLGAIVKGYGLKPEKENDFYNLIDGDSLCSSVIADIRDLNKLSEIIQDFQPDFIFHFAAQSIVRRSYEEPLYTFEVNVLGTVNLVEALRYLKKKCSVIVVTTDKVYENNETGEAYKEDAKLGGYDPYSASKAAAEIVVNSYRNSFFNISDYSVHQKAIATARAGNVIGGGDRSTDRLIPDIIKGIENSKTVVVRNPNAIRPWQYVLEPLNGYLLLGSLMHREPVEFSGAWNFGPYEHDVLEVREVVRETLNIISVGAYEETTISNQPHEAKKLNLCINKAIEKMGWKPKLSVREAIKYTVLWYKEAPVAGIRDYSIRQLSQYIAIP